MAATLEFGGEPGVHDLEGEVGGDLAGAEGDGVGVVVLGGEAGGVLVPAEGAADAADFVGDDGFAVAGAAEDDGAVGAAIGGGLGRGADEVGVVHGLGAVGAEVEDLMAEGAEVGGDKLLELEAGVVGAEGDFHGEVGARNGPRWLPAQNFNGARSALANEGLEVGEVGGEAAGAAFVDDGDGVVGVEGFEVGAGDLEVADAGVAIEAFVEEAGGVLDEFGEGAVELGKGLFVLAADHDLGLGLEGGEGVVVEVFDGEVGAGEDFDGEAGLGALGVGDGEGGAVLAGVLGEFGGAGAGGGVDEVEVNDFAEAVEVAEGAFVNDAVELPAGEAGAERRLEERVVEGEAQVGAGGGELGFVAEEDFLEKVGGEDAVLKLVEHAHEAGHVDALLVAGEGDGAGDGGLEGELALVGGEEAEGEAEIGDADLEDGDLGALDFGDGGVLHVGQGGAVSGSDLEMGVVGATEVRALLRSAARSCGG